MNPPALGAFDFRETVRHGPMMPTSQVFVIRFWLLPKVCWQLWAISAQLHHTSPREPKRPRPSKELDMRVKRLKLGALLDTALLR